MEKANVVIRMYRFPAFDNYQGPLPLFPLPNVVFFPYAFLPLHVFEPRYRQMVQDGMERDSLIGIVLLKPGWENQYNANPPVYEIACMGQMVRVEALPDGRYNILVHGFKRVKIESISDKKMYRAARVQVLQDEPARFHPRKENNLRREIFEALSRVIEPPFWGFSVLSAPHLDLGVLVDLIAFSLPLDPVEKQRILDAISVENRVDELVHILEEEEGKGKRVRVKQLPFLHELARN